MRTFIMTIAGAAALLLCSAFRAEAQDVITLRNGDQVQAKIIKISDTEVEYKVWNYLDGPTRTKSTADIFMIQYENGSKEVFKEQPAKTAQAMTGVPGTGMSVPLTDSYGRSLELETDKDSRSYLSLGGRPISEQDALNLLGRRDYEEYLKGYGFKKGGVPSLIAGGACFAVGVPLFVIGLVEEVPVMSIVGLPLLAGGLGAGVTGLIFTLVGNNKMKKVLDGYNRYGGYNYSMSIEPATSGIGIVMRF